MSSSDYFKEKDQPKKRTSAGPERLLPKRSTLPFIRLLQKRSEARELHNTTRDQRDELASAHSDLQKRQDMLSERESKMKEDVQTFGNFLKENEMKRRQAVAKADRERVLMNQKHADTLSLREELTALIKKRERLEQRLQKHAIFQIYMERVVQASEEFEEPREMMSRFDTLMQTREDLVRTTQLNEDSILNARAQLARFTEQSNVTLLHFNNTLAELQSQLHEAEKTRVYRESCWVHIQNTAAKKTLLLGTIKMATLNLYQSVCKTSNDHGEPPVAPEDTPQQLEKMKIYFANLKSICEHVGRPRQMARGH